MLERDLTFSIRASSYKRSSMIFYIDTQRWSKQPVTNARRHPIAMPHRRGDKLTATPQDLWYQHLRLCQSTCSSILADARPHGLRLCCWPPFRRRGSGVQFAWLARIHRVIRRRSIWIFSRYEPPQARQILFHTLGVDFLRLIEPRVKELTMWETQCLSVCCQGTCHWVSCWASWRSTCHTGRNVARQEGRALHHCTSRKTRHLCSH